MTEPHAPAGPGFVHVASAVLLTVTLARGLKRAVFSAAELEVRCGMPGMARGLGAVLDEACIARAADGDSPEPIPSMNANADRNSWALAFGEKEGGTGEPSGSRPVDKRAEIEGFARYLAQTLGDTTFHDGAFYKLVARTVDRAVVLDMLGRAKDARDVRKSRAHLFAYLIRDYLPKRKASRSPDL